MRENEQKIKVLESFDQPNFVSTPREDGEGKNNSSLAIEFIDDSYTAMENVDRKILIETIWKDFFQNKFATIASICLRKT